jgi:hypothetical protein
MKIQDIQQFSSSKKKAKKKYGIKIQDFTYFKKNGIKNYTDLHAYLYFFKESSPLFFKFPPVFLKQMSYGTLVHTNLVIFRNIKIKKRVQRYLILVLFFLTKIINSLYSIIVERNIVAWLYKSISMKTLTSDDIVLKIVSFEISRPDGRTCTLTSNTCSLAKFPSEQNKIKHIFNISINLNSN